MSLQEGFTNHLVYGKQPPPKGLKTWNGSDPRQRFEIYRNKVIVSLIDALVDSFPVTQALLGEDFFRAMAKAYIQDHPPKSRVLAWIGSNFPNFISEFPPAASLPYLADIAQLEMSRIHAYHAADVSPLDIDALSGFISQPELIPTLKLILHPSLHLVQSSHAIFSIWAAHQGTMEFTSINPSVAEAVMVFRKDLSVESLRVSLADNCFLKQLLSMNSIESANDQAIKYDEMFDASGILTLLIQKQLITHYIL